MDEHIKVPLVFYSSQGERTVIGTAKVFDDGVIHGEVTDEVAKEFMFSHSKLVDMGFSIQPVRPASVRLTATNPGEETNFVIKFDPGKFGINPVDEDDPDKTLSTEVFREIRDSQQEQ